MDNSSRDLLRKVLDIIGYSDDKEVFIDKFQENIGLGSIVNLIASLPPDKQKEVSDKLSVSKNDEEKASVLKTSFTEEQLQGSLEKSVQEAIVGYIEAVKPTLNSKQKDELANLFEEVQSMGQG